MTVRPRKRAIRAEVIARVLAMSPRDREHQESVLASAFPTLPGFREAGTVLLYANAFPEEFSTVAMLKASQDAGKMIVCPRVAPDGSHLLLFAIEDLSADFESGRLGIPEPRRSCLPVLPEEIDWVLVPGVAFDRRGFRIGRGAGHYDRLLPKLRADVPRWSLAFDEQWIAMVPDEFHDQPLDGVVSPSGRFDRRR
jgi:5-formyltetrahydrofolate cyclo-ligase